MRNIDVYEEVPIQNLDSATVDQAFDFTWVNKWAIGLVRSLINPMMTINCVSNMSVRPPCNYFPISCGPFSNKIRIHGAFYVSTESPPIKTILL